MVLVIVILFVIGLVLAICSLSTQKRLVRELNRGFPAIASQLALDREFLSRGPADGFRFLRFVFNRDGWPSGNAEVTRLLEQTRRLDIAYFIVFGLTFILLFIFLS